MPPSCRWGVLRGIGKILIFFCAKFVLGLELGRTIGYLIAKSRREFSAALQAEIRYRIGASHRDWVL
ncbi:MAG: hypothetical protein D6741_01700 [Planctomycetota bacterium]|nr:MAG: hypothetical protein D6741_01700 [Planctomycetota bacterium]